MFRIIFTAAVWLAMVGLALAQSSPGLIFGQVPTAAQWNAIFATKMDYLGSPAITAAGGTLTGKLNLANSTTGTAGLNCGVGTAPSTPTNGDFWCTSSGVFARINGSTIMLGGAGGVATVPNGGTGQSTFTANLPLIGNGASAIAQGTVTSTNGSTLFATASGVPGNGNCAAWSNGNVVDAGVGACGGTGGAGTVSSSTTGQVAVYSGATTVSGISACNSGYYGTDGSGVVTCRTSILAALQSTITQVGTIATGVWNGTVVTGQYGGTGVANTGFTITLAGNLITAGANALTLTTIGATNVTFPTSGTLMNQTGTSGGIPYYSSGTTVASSAALTANAPVIGGGAGSSPTVGTRSGNTTTFATTTGSLTSTHCASFDASGNLTDSGQTCAGAGGAPVLLTTINCASVSGCTDINGTCPAASATTGCFDNTYSRYEIVLENLVATTPSTAVGCQIHIYNSGGGYQTSGYLSNYAGALASSNITQYIACWPSNTGLSNSLTAPGASGSFIVYNPSASAKTVIRGAVDVASGGISNNILSGGWWNTNSIIVGFRICAATSPGTCGSTWASGTIKVYGLP